MRCCAFVYHGHNVMWGGWGVGELPTANLGSSNDKKRQSNRRPSMSVERRSSCGEGQAWGDCARNGRRRGEGRARAGVAAH